MTLLQEAKVPISMAARAFPRENAYIERFMRTLREEEVYLHEYADLPDATAYIAHFLEHLYMYPLVHSALDYLPSA